MLRLFALILPLFLFNHSAQSSPRSGAKAYILTAELDKNSWGSRTFYKRYLIAYLYQDGNGKKTVVWEEYNRENNELVARSYADENRLAVTFEERRSLFEWDLDKYDIFFPQLLFVREPNVFSGFKLLEMDANPNYLPGPEARMKREEALKRYDPSNMNAIEALPSQTTGLLADHVLFLRDKLTSELLNLMLKKEGLTSMQLLPYLVDALGEHAVKSIETSIRDGHEKTRGFIGTIIEEDDRLVENINRPDQLLLENRGSSFFALKQELYKHLYIRLKGSKEKYAKKTEKERLMERLLSLFDDNNLKRVVLKPGEDTTNSGRVQEINYHLTAMEMIPDFISVKWSHGNTSLRTKFYLTSSSYGSLINVVKNKIKEMNDLKGYEVYKDVKPALLMNDAVEEYDPESVFFALIENFSYRISSGNIDASISVDTDLPDNSVLRIKVLRSGYDFVQGADISEDAFIRFSNAHVATNKFKVGNGKGSVELRLKPGKYIIVLEFSLDDQTDLKVRERYKGVYLVESDRLGIIAPYSDGYTDIVESEYNLLVDSMEKLRKLGEEILSSDPEGLAGNIGAYRTEGSVIMAGLKNREFLLSAARDYATLVIYFISEKLLRIREINKKDNSVALAPKEGAQSSEDILLPIDVLRSQTEILYNKFYSCLTREAFLNVLESLKGLVSQGVDRGMFSDLKSSVSLLAGKVVKMDVYKEFLHKLFTVPYKEGEVSFLINIDDVFSSDIFNDDRGKLNDLVVIARILERRLMYGK